MEIKAETTVELRLLIVKHFLLRTMEQCCEETMPPQMLPCKLYLCIMYCPMFVWESYLRCLTFQILYNELGLHWLYKLPIEPPWKHLHHFYHLFIFCSLLIFRLIWNKYSILRLIDACTRFSICARLASAGTRSYVLSVADKIHKVLD